MQSMGGKPQSPTAEHKMLTESEIFAALRDCFDPEVKLNLVDLGLIYSIETGPDPDSTPAWPRQWVKVTMTLTTQFCPASGLIFEQVHNRLATIPDISKVEVNLVWEPKWTPHRISEAGRKQLGL
jgi:metal-sulfur cluster biosynthetic enzyme